MMCRLPLSALLCAVDTVYPDGNHTAADTFDDDDDDGRITRDARLNLTSPPSILDRYLSQSQTSSKEYLKSKALVQPVVVATSTMIIIFSRHPAA